MAVAAATLSSTTTVPASLAEVGGQAWVSANGTDESGLALMRGFLSQFQDNCDLPLHVAVFDADTAGSGIALDATTTAAVKVYSDDNGAAIGSGTMVRAGEFRHLQTDVTGNREEEAVGVIGKLVSVAGVNRHNMCGVMGSYEMKGTIVVDGQIASTDAWVQAGVIGRVGMSSGTLTLNTYGVLAGVAAMSNIAAAVTQTYTGNYVGYYAGRWGTADKFEYAFYAENVVAGSYISSDAGAISGEAHANDIVSTGTLSSGDSLVGLNIAVTTAGTAGTWASGIYAKVVQGTTKNVNGYLSGAEIEVVNTNTNPSDWFPLVLNANSTTDSQHAAYIACRSYGTHALSRLFWIEDQTIAGDGDTASLVSANNPTAATHCIKIIIDDTDYWLMAVNLTGLTA